METTHQVQRVGPGLLVAIGAAGIVMYGGALPGLLHELAGIVDARGADQVAWARPALMAAVSWAVFSGAIAAFLFSRPAPGGERVAGKIAAALLLLAAVAVAGTAVTCLREFGKVAATDDFADWAQRWNEQGGPTAAAWLMTQRLAVLGAAAAVFWMSCSAVRLRGSIPRTGPVAVAISLMLTALMVLSWRRVIEVESAISSDTDPTAFAASMVNLHLITMAAAMCTAVLAALLLARQFLAPPPETPAFPVGPADLE